MGIKKNKQAFPRLATDGGVRVDESSAGNPIGVRPRRKRRAAYQKTVVKPLDAPNAGVLNVSSLKFLKPFGADIGSLREVAPGKGAIPQEPHSSIKQGGFGHAPSIGKVLPDSQLPVSGSSETLYRPPSVIFSRMLRETTDSVLTALASNASALMDQLGMSDAAVAEATKEISPKSVNNVANGRHSVTVGTTAAVAHGLGVEAWQLLLPNLPLDHQSQRSLALIVQAFLKLPSARDALRRIAENEAKGEGKYGEIFGTPGRKVANLR